MWQIGVFCGAKIWRLRDWKMYGLYHKLKGGNGFAIGPVLIYRE